VYSIMDGKRTSLNEGLVASFERAGKGPFVGMNALVPGQIRSTAESLVSSKPKQSNLLWCSPPNCMGKGEFLVDYLGAPDR
jgi:hypothetical protein